MIGMTGMTGPPMPAPPPLQPLDTAPATTPAGLVLHVARGRDAGGLVQAMHDLVGDRDAPKPRFPGPNPVSLERASLAGLDPAKYWVCEKTDGVRYALVATTYRGHRLLTLFDRTLTPYVVPLAAVPCAWFQGTVVDGELAFDKASKRHVFLAFDAVMVSGVPVFHLPLSRRLDALRTSMRDYAPHEADPFGIRIKTFFALARLDAFEAALDAVRARYDIDGLVLSPEAGDVVYGRHMGMYKFKPFGGAAAHTVDFLVGADGRQLLVFDAGRHVTVAVLVSGGQAAVPDTIVECAHVRGDEWRAVGTRQDKATANDAFTFRKTVLNIQEAIGLGDLRTVVVRHAGGPGGTKLTVDPGAPAHA
jgi:hypothetical protein